jgi:hypothetical protein
MSDQYVQVTPDSTGKKIDTSEIVVGANTVERQRIVLADPTTAESFVSVTNSALQVQVIGNLMQNYEPAQGAQSIDNTNGPTANVQLDPDSQLMTRGTVLTDEGSKRDDFGEEGALVQTLTGTITVVNGSKVVTGAGTSFLSQVEENDYIKVSTDSETYWAQVFQTNSNTSITLVSGYGGSSQAGVTGVYTDWPSITTGSGMTATEASSLMTIATGVNSGDQKILYRVFDYQPVTIIGRFYLSQMIANQVFTFGLADSPSSPGHYVTVSFSGTDPSKVNFNTGCTSNAAYEQTGTYTIPNGLVTSYNTYQIDLNSNQALLTINNVVVASFNYHIPYLYTPLNAFFSAQNTGVPAGSTNFILDWVQMSNYDEINITSHIPINTNASITTQAGANTAPWFATVNPLSRLRVSGETINVFTENFDAFQLDSNKWASPIINGIAKWSNTSGNLTLACDGNVNTAVQLNSVPTFSPQGTDSYIISIPVQLETSNIITNVHRFWGVGTVPSSYSATTPLYNAIGFEVDTTGSLNACIYANGSKVFNQALVCPTDGAAHRYRIIYRVDQVNFYLDTFDIPQARAQYIAPNVLQLPVHLHIINSGSTPSSAPSLILTSVSVADTGNNFVALSDGTYPFRKTTVSPTGNLSVQLGDGWGGSSNKAYVDPTGAVNVSVLADLDSLKTGNTFTLEHALHDPTYPTYVKFDRYGKQIGGTSIPVTLASDDVVPMVPAIAPVIGGSINAVNASAVGPISMAGYSSAIVQFYGGGVLGTNAFSVAVTFQATTDDPINGVWTPIGNTNLSTGVFTSGAGAVTVAASASFYVNLAGFQYFRINCGTATTVPAFVKIIRLGIIAPNSTLAASVTAAGGAAVGAAASGNPVELAGTDGTTNNYIRQATITPPNVPYFPPTANTVFPTLTPLSGLTTSQPNVLLMGGVDGSYVAATAQGNTNYSLLGYARALLTDASGVLQVNNVAETQHRIETRETNALLVQILNELDTNNVLAEHMPAFLNTINSLNDTIAAANTISVPSATLLSGQVTLTQTAQLLPYRPSHRVTVQSSNANAVNNTIIYLGQQGTEYFELQAGQSQTFDIANLNLISAYCSGVTNAALNWVVEP